MKDRALMDKLLLALEPLDNLGIGLLDVQAGEVAHLSSKPAFVIHRINQVDAGLLARVEIVLPKGRGDMNDAGAFFGGDMICGDYAETPSLFVEGEVRKEWSIGSTQQILTLVALLDSVSAGLGEVHFQAGLGHDVAAAILVVPHLDVSDLRPDRQGQIARQGPGSGRPSDEIGFLFAVRGKTHSDGWVLDVFVVEISFEVGEHSTETRRKGHDLVAFIDQTLVPQSLKDPPHALHE